MKKIVLQFISIILAFPGFTQPAQTPAWNNVYRETALRINDLVHTKLAVSFDYQRSWLYGKAWITLQPHFYPADSLVLDAKQMHI